MLRYVDQELEQFIAHHIIVEDLGSRAYTSSMAEAWRVVERMIQKYYVELKLDMFLGVTGEHWVASFYSPVKCARYEGKGPTAPLAVCRAAREAYNNLTPEI
uniref:Phage ABA sandwich domain-containing protein n=1 Tax=Desulfobacca acetoxidans TaxID=60893 RepID=A0A7C5AMK7_9BACT